MNGCLQNEIKAWSHFTKETKQDRTWKAFFSINWCAVSIPRKRKAPQRSIRTLLSFRKPPRAGNPASKMKQTLVSHLYATESNLQVTSPTKLNRISLTEQRTSFTCHKSWQYIYCKKLLGSVRTRWESGYIANRGRVRILFVLSRISQFRIWARTEMLRIRTWNLSGSLQGLSDSWFLNKKFAA